MKKIGIVTLHGYYNYGNNLQNFALLYILEKYGYDTSTVIIKEKKINKFINKMKYIYKLNLNAEVIFKKIIKKLSRNNKVITNEEIAIHNNRMNKFKQFSQQYLNEFFYMLNNPKDLAGLQGFSFFITGSDQVWNPNLRLPIYFLTFAPKEKRISYAPSIARDKIPTKYIDDYKHWLEGMSAVSVREESGANIIKELTGIEAPVLVDPTMLLTREEWLSISKRASNRPDEPYLLTYFLGGPTDETRKKLEKLAAEKNMKIINLGDITEKETYETGPSEFLDYINNASAFFTDSFHGVVFSIIFETPFIVYERVSSGPSMYSRIETLLEKFDMKNREAKGFKEDVFSMDFSGTNEIFDQEYEKSINYLKNALRIED